MSAKRKGSALLSWKPIGAEAPIGKWYGPSGLFF